MAQACELQESFEESKTDEGCAVMWSHGTNTFKVKGLCPKCAGKKEKEDAKYSEVKSKIKDLKSEAKVLLDDITRILERCNVLGVRQDSETALPSDGSGSAKSEGWICAATLSDESEMLAPERFEPAEEVQVSEIPV